MTALTPAAIEADPHRCCTDHGDSAATDPATLHHQAAALAPVLVHAAAELQVVPAAVFATGLALTAHIPAAHSVMDGGDTRVQQVDLLPGNVITGDQEDPGLDPQATEEQVLCTVAESGVGFLPHL